MAGHSKWANIKHHKAIEDAKKGKIFTKHAKLIAVAAQKGGDIGSNPNLRVAIENAKAVGVPKENIERAIKKGTGELRDGNVIEELVYEAFGPNGVAIIIDVLTDKRNRTLGDLKVLLNKNGGRLAEEGAVAWMFRKLGKVTIETLGVKKDDFEFQLIDAGVVDYKFEFDKEGKFKFEVFCQFDEMNEMSEKIQKYQIGKIKILSSEKYFKPNNPININKNGENYNQILKLLEVLESHDDVDKVWCNLE